MDNKATSLSWCPSHSNSPFIQRDTVDGWGDGGRQEGREGVCREEGIEGGMEQWRMGIMEGGNNRLRGG